MHDLSSRPGETIETSFSASDYFLGIAQRIISTGEDTRVILPGKGEISLFPAQNEYHADVPDMQAFCRAPAAQFQLSKPDGAVLPQGQGNRMGELLWQAAFHASQGRLIEGCSKYDVVQFRRWPNLSRLPKTPNTMRACALLTRFPTTVMLVPRRLNAEKGEIYQIYSSAFCAGIVNMVSRNPQVAAGAAETEPQEPAPERRLLRSLFTKISGL